MDVVSTLKIIRNELPIILQSLAVGFPILIEGNQPDVTELITALEPLCPPRTIIEAYLKDNNIEEMIKRSPVQIIGLSRRKTINNKTVLHISARSKSIIYSPLKQATTFWRDVANNLLKLKTASEIEAQIQISWTKLVNWAEELNKGILDKNISQFLKSVKSSLGGNDNLEMLIAFIMTHGQLPNRLQTAEDISSIISEQKVTDEAVPLEMETATVESVTPTDSGVSQQIIEEQLSQIQNQISKINSNEAQAVNEAIISEEVVQPPPPSEEIVITQPKSESKTRQDMNISLALSGFSKLFPQIQLIGIYQIDSTPVLFGKENEIISKEIESTIQVYNNTIQKMIENTGNPSSFETAKQMVYFNLIERANKNSLFLAVVAEKGISPLEIAPEDIKRISNAVSRLMS
ncbi:MAG: hypothetical protein ACFFCZ_10900 [Promethearchaeota archaeon]